VDARVAGVYDGVRRPELQVSEARRPQEGTEGGGVAWVVQTRSDAGSVGGGPSSF